MTKNLPIPIKLKSSQRRHTYHEVGGHVVSKHLVQPFRRMRHRFVRSILLLNETSTEGAYLLSMEILITKSI